MSRNSTTWRWLWGFLFLFQLLQFSIFYGLLHSPWMHEKMLYWAFLAVLANVFVIKWSLKLFGWNPLDYSPSTDSKFVKWNTIAAAGIALFLPVMSLLLCETPWRYLPDGPLQGPMPVSALTDSDVRGVIEFSDGRARHDYGWGIEVISTKFTELTYADPFVAEDWDTGDPVTVWVVHSKYDEELTAEHRFGYVVSQNYTKRSFWNRIITGALEEHELRAPDERIIVKLGTRGPRFGEGPSIMQFVFGLYFFLGLYLGFIAYAFGWSGPVKPVN